MPNTVPALTTLGFGAAPDVMVADKLIEVFLRDGSAKWVVIHIEVQAQRDTALARRVFDYNYRISKEYGRPVASLVILADDDPTWRPSCFQDQLFGVTTTFFFRTAKLLDYATDMDALSVSHNPFALQEIVQWSEERDMELLNQWEQMCLDKGMKKGLEQGRKEGAVALLARQLTRRFGPLPKAVQNKLAKASLAQVEAWSDLLFDASTMKQVFNSAQ